MSHQGCQSGLLAAAVTGVATRLDASPLALVRATLSSSGLSVSTRPPARRHPSGLLQDTRCHVTWRFKRELWAMQPHTTTSCSALATSARSKHHTSSVLRAAARVGAYPATCNGVLHSTMMSPIFTSLSGAPSHAHTAHCTQNPAATTKEGCTASRRRARHHHNPQPSSQWHAPMSSRTDLGACWRRCACL
jgi:hypothetical protein